MPLQRLLQRGQGREFISGFRDIALQNLTLVINRAPQVMPLAVDLDEYLVKVSAPLPKSPHPIHPLAPDVRGKQRPEPVPP